MADHETRSREDEYFWRRDQELIEKLRRAAASAQANRELGAKAGLDDPEVIQELAALGFTTETVDLLPLMPLVQVAWADGDVSDAERQLVIKLARLRGIGEASAADRQLSTWLATCPDAQVFVRSTRLIRAMLASKATSEASLTPNELVTYCEEIAKASGGILGLRTISAKERVLLSQIATALNPGNHST